MSSNSRSINPLSLEELFFDFLNWSTTAYLFGSATTKAHIALGRCQYVVSLKDKRPDILQYSILWDIALWLHDGDYFAHPKTTYEWLLEELNVPAITQTEYACFMVFDQMYQEGEAEPYLNEAINLIGLFPIRKNQYGILMKNYSEILNGKEKIYRD